MPEDPIEPREHYVYALYREDGVTPFYIGLGTRRRWLRHEIEFDGRNPHKENIIRKMHRAGIQPIPKAKLAEGLTPGEAAKLEIDLIARIGRFPDGPLVNMTSGGDGIADVPAESRARQRQATVDRWAVDREGMMRGIRLAVEAARAPEVNERRKQSLRDFWQTPGNKGKRRKAEWSPEKREHMRAVMTEPAMRKKIAQESAERWKDPEYRELVRQKLTATLATPEAKAKRSAGLKKMWAERREHIMAARALKRSQKTDPIQDREPSHGKSE